MEQRITSTGFPWSPCHSCEFFLTFPKSSSALQLKMKQTKRGKGQEEQRSKVKDHKWRQYITPGPRHDRQGFLHLHLETKSNDNPSRESALTFVQRFLNISVE